MSTGRILSLQYIMVLQFLYMYSLMRFGTPLISNPLLIALCQKLLRYQLLLQFHLVFFHFCKGTVEDDYVVFAAIPFCLGLLLNF